MHVNEILNNHKVPDYDRKHTMLVMCSVLKKPDYGCWLKDIVVYKYYLKGILKVLPSDLDVWMLSVKYIVKLMSEIHNNFSHFL